MTIPGVQKPHCDPCISVIRSCTGCMSDVEPIPSTVVTAHQSAAQTGIRLRCSEARPREGAGARAACVGQGAPEDAFQKSVAVAAGVGTTASTADVGMLLLGCRSGGRQLPVGRASGAGWRAPSIDGGVADGAPLPASQLESITVHAPQPPSPHPSFVPVRPMERSHSSSVMVGFTSESS